MKVDSPLEIWSVWGGQCHSIVPEVLMSAQIRCQLSTQKPNQGRRSLATLDIAYLVLHPQARRLLVTPGLSR